MTLVAKPTRAAVRLVPGCLLLGGLLLGLWFGVSGAAPVDGSRAEGGPLSGGPVSQAPFRLLRPDVTPAAAGQEAAGPDAPDFTFDKRVMLSTDYDQKKSCTGSVNSLTVPYNTAVVYCYLFRNIGDTTFVSHTMRDDKLGNVEGIALSVGPSTSAGFIADPPPLTEDVTNTAVWIAEDENGFLVTHSDSVTVHVLPPDTATPTASPTVTPTPSPTGTPFARQSTGYLPLILWQPVPLQRATMDPIAPPGQNSTYAVSWQAVPGARGYVLESATAASFEGAKVVYNGPNRSYTVASRGIAMYYYRVMPYNNWVEGSWSDPRTVEVRWEDDANNSSAAADGPLLPAARYYAFPDDPNDYFYFELGRVGAAWVEVYGHTGDQVELSLWHQSTSSQTSYRGGAWGVGSALFGAADLAPGRYYVQVNTDGGYNTRTAYTLFVNY